MKERLAGRFAVVAELADKFKLAALDSTLQACRALSNDAPLDVAVLGQFKSGKSSLLNAVLGENLFPVGVLPVTAVITRAAAGNELHVQVTQLDGEVKEIEPEQVAEYVTEGGNPGNQRQVAIVDVLTPRMSGWPGVRLVDTPGLGSVLAHTKATQNWLPNVAVALVAVSAERPLSEEDRRLVAEARATAPRVIVILTKVDLLSEAERAEVSTYLDRTLREHFVTDIAILHFSARVNPEHWVGRLRETVLQPVAGNVTQERKAALALKLTVAERACHGYLAVGLQAAERAEADRERVRTAVLDEQVKLEVIRDELSLAQQRMVAALRPTFQDRFLGHESSLVGRITGALNSEVRTWKGNLAQQARRYEGWMAARLSAELQTVSRQAEPSALEMLRQAEGRFRRIVEAFRDRLTRNIQQATGITVCSVDWEVKRPAIKTVPVALSSTFMTHWDLLWWLLPMSLVGGLFRRHIRKRVPWEVEKNLIRLTGDWSAAVEAVVADLSRQASAWVKAELDTLDQLLAHRSTDAAVFGQAIRQLESLHVPEDE